MCVAPEGLAQGRSVLHVLVQPKLSSDISFVFSELDFDDLSFGHSPQDFVSTFEEEHP